jgi:hypothetical protein
VKPNGSELVENGSTLNSGSRKRRKNTYDTCSPVNTVHTMITTWSLFHVSAVLPQPINSPMRDLEVTGQTKGPPSEDLLLIWERTHYIHLVIMTIRKLRIFGRDDMQRALGNMNITEPALGISLRNPMEMTFVAALNVHPSPATLAVAWKINNESPGKASGSHICLRTIRSDKQLIIVASVDVGL